jgi:lipid A 4'-phosphatase
MNRTGLVIALAIGVVTGVVFALFPSLDIAISKPFFNEQYKVFWLTLYAVHLGGGWVLTLRKFSMWIVAALAAPAVIALAVKLVWPKTATFMSGRAAVFLLASLLLGPGLLTNGLLKAYDGRPRPVEITQFGSTERFLPWWDPRGSCDDNCSFVAGEPSGAFWTLAPAALAPPQWRAAAYAAALAFGVVVGLMRIAMGGHFFTDVVFSGVFTYLIIWIVYALVYRWPLPASLRRVFAREEPAALRGKAFRL